MFDSLFNVIDQQKINFPYNADQNYIELQKNENFLCAPIRIQAKMTDQ